MVDDFDKYASGSYIQEQNPAWSRYGKATVDGIDSIEAGSKNRGASYVATWTPENTVGAVKYTFPAPQDMTKTPVLNIELAVTPSTIMGTTVSALVANKTTKYRVSLPQTLSSDSYTLFSFPFNDTAEILEGKDTLQTVLAAPTSVTITFSNTSGKGTQTIHFDNLTLSAPQK